MSATERRRRAFNADEDDRLRGLVARLGDADWRAVAAKMPRRNRRQCRERWVNYLSPAVCNATWSHGEDELLRAKVQECGRKWRTIQGFFPGRSDVNIKNHWRQLQRGDEKKEKLQLSEEPGRGSLSGQLDGTARPEKRAEPPPNGAADSDEFWLCWFDR
jgi:hypothetical protein